MNKGWSSHRFRSIVGPFDSSGGKDYIQSDDGSKPELEPYSWTDPANIYRRTCHFVRSSRSERNQQPFDSLEKKAPIYSSSLHPVG